MTFVYSLKNFKQNDADFFCDMVAYVSPRIEKTARNGSEIEVTCCTGYENEIREKLDKLSDMIQEDSRSGREIGVHTIIDNTHIKPQNKGSVFDAMIEKGFVKEICSGVYAYSGLFLKVMRYFDRKIAEFAEEQFDTPIEFDFPVLYPVADYEKGRYFETFPHHIMFQSNMKNDITVLDRFAKNGIGEQDILNEMKTPQNVLRHAACVPVYAMMKNSVIKDDEPVCFLISGKCFRNEGTNVFELARLNEFYMKEYVFLGTPDSCAQRIEKAKSIWAHWTDVFSLNCKIETANDSFFASNYKKLRKFQILGNSKQEFKVQIPFSGKYIACGSVNHHRTHFSKPYNITLESGTLCFTACFAFGIERLAYAFLSQKGIDPVLWDTASRTEIEQYIKL